MKEMGNKDLIINGGASTSPSFKIEKTPTVVHAAVDILCTCLFVFHESKYLE
jgi:hypothetical protein